MYCILVAGMPASGKSTIARYLAGKLEIPMISKDNLKEIMFDEIGFGSREEKNKLGRASMKIMYHIAEQMMATNTAFILENNFEDISKDELMQLLKKYDYTAITVWLTGAYERFVANGPCIVVDTTDISGVDRNAVLKQVEEAIGRLRGMQTMLQK